MSVQPSRAMIVDTHCHLADEAFAADLDDVIERARSAGVARALVMGESFADNVRILDLCRQRAGFLGPCAGHYPSELDREMADCTEAFIRAHRDELVAIGEVGIDHRITEDPGERALQYQIFTRFVRLSAELDLPLSVHSRSAGRHAIDLLRASPARKVVMHAFDGRYGTAIPGLEAGYFFSVPPSIVRSVQKQKLVRQIPIDRLLLESDAPVLGPEPDVRNEPANVLISARAIAEIKGLSADEVLERTGANAATLFGPG